MTQANGIETEQVISSRVDVPASAPILGSYSGVGAGVFVLERAMDYE